MPSFHSSSETREPGSHTRAGASGSRTCSASGLQDSEYRGGDAAYIHLVGYSSGNYYPVEKKGKVVTGVTSNGTKFTCRAS